MKHALVLVALLAVAAAATATTAVGIFSDGGTPHKVGEARHFTVTIEDEDAISDRRGQITVEVTGPDGVQDLGTQEYHFNDPLAGESGTNRTLTFPWNVPTTPGAYVAEVSVDVWDGPPVTYQPRSLGIPVQHGPVVDVRATDLSTVPALRLDEMRILAYNAHSDTVPGVPVGVPVFARASLYDSYGNLADTSNQAIRIRDGTGADYQITPQGGRATFQVLYMEDGAPTLTVSLPTAGEPIDSESQVLNLISAPAPVRFLEATAVAGDVVVSWLPPRGEGNATHGTHDGAPLLGYWIHRDGVPWANAPAGAVAFHDPGAANGSHTYTVQAYTGAQPSAERTTTYTAPSDPAPGGGGVIEEPRLGSKHVAFGVAITVAVVAIALRTGLGIAMAFGSLGALTAVLYLMSLL